MTPKEFMKENNIEDFRFLIFTGQGFDLHVSDCFSISAPHPYIPCARGVHFYISQLTHDVAFHLSISCNNRGFGISHSIGGEAPYL